MASSSSTARIPAIDALRGLLLVLMTIVHLPGLLGSLLSEVWGFVGTAEGFVFIAALLTGLLFRSNRRGSIWRVFLKKAVYLYVAQIAVVSFLLITVQLFPQFALRWREFGILPETTTPEGLLSAMLLLYQPRYLDIIPLFCGFMLFAPLLLSRFSATRALVALTISIGCWALSQSLDLKVLLNPIVSHFGLIQYDQSPFRFLAWQLLFVIGVLLGRTYNRQGEREGAGIKIAYRVAIAVSLGVTLFSLTWRHQLYAWNIPSSVVPLLVGKDNLGLLRIAQVLSYTLLITTLVRTIPASVAAKSIMRRGSAWLSLLGRHSLSVYLFHITLLYLLSPYRKSWHFTWPLSLQLLVTAAVLGSLSIPALVFSRRKAARRKLEFRNKESVPLQIVAAG